jgi:glucose/arabinose dehydrogenase/PKD repeat protein
MFLLETSFIIIIKTYASMNLYFNHNCLIQKAIICLWVCLFSISAYSQLPAGFVDVKVQGSYAMPMGVVFSKNGQQMFVWEKKGMLWISKWNGTTYVKQDAVLLDITQEASDWSDYGLQSVALDPNFESNGLLYLFYQVDRHHLLYFGTPQYDPTKNEYANATISRITRFKVNNAGGVFTTDYASRKVLLGESKTTGIPAIYTTHVGGQLVFGADGTLFVTTGDNASFNGPDTGSHVDTYWQQAIADGIMRSTENVGSFRCQMLNSFCGKLLRIDPNTGNGLPSNPHYDAANPRSAASRMWAMGFRNPYRCAFKTGTGSTNPAAGNPGTIIVGDVLHDTWDGMYIIEKSGTNCGWPIYEGIEPHSTFVGITTVNKEEPGQPTFASLCVQPTSGTLNADAKQRRFKHFPTSLDWRHGQNIARYPDYSTGTLKAKTIGSAGSMVIGTPFQGSCSTAGTVYKGTAFPSKYQGAYFFADYTAGWIKGAVIHDNSDHAIHEVLDFAPLKHCDGVVDVEYCPMEGGSLYYVEINTGRVRKISFGGNRPPIAAISANKTTGASPLTVIFSSNGSSDPDGDPLTYQWDFGDGSPNSTLPNPTHTFTSTVSKGFTVTLTLKDSKGLSDFKTMVVSLNNSPPSVKITSPVNNSKYAMTGPTQYTLKATVTDNDPTGMQYAWQVMLRHNTHEHREPFNTQQSPTIQIAPAGCDGQTYYYMIELTVTDKGGLKARDSVKVYPNCQTNPSPFDPTKCYRLIARNSNKDMEIPTNSTADGIGIQQNTWAYSRRQVWRIKPFDGTYYRLLNGYSGKVAEVKGAFLYSGAGMQQNANNGGDNQKWRFDKNTEGYYFITAKHSGLVADVKGASTANGANIQQSLKNGGTNQQWKVAEIGCPAGTVASQSAQIYAVDGYREGQKGIITWVSNAENADYFIVEKQNKDGDFEKLNTVDAKPLVDFSDKNSYSYTDNETFEGENIYRVGLIADKEPPQYSSPILLNFKALTDFALYPNPTSDYVEIDLIPYENRAVVLTVIDASGKEVRLVKIEKAAKTQRLELDGLTTGQYLVRIQTVGKRDVTRLLNLAK